MEPRGLLPTDPTGREKWGRPRGRLLHGRVRARLTGIHATGGWAICHNISTATARPSQSLLVNKVRRGDIHSLGTLGYEVHVLLKVGACCEVWLNISIFYTVHHLLCNNTRHKQLSIPSAMNSFICSLSPKQLL
jgi:hypothetical protein